MDRITVKDVRLMFRNYAELLAGYGLVCDGFRLVLQEGSPSACLAWRIFEERVDGSGGLSRPMVGGDYLGWSVREAYDRLVDRLSVVADAVYHVSCARRAAGQVTE